MIEWIRNRRSISVLSLALAGALGLLAGATVTGAIEDRAAGSSKSAAIAATDPVRNLPNFTELAKRVGPSVVNVSTTQVRRSAQGVPSPFGPGDPRNEFLERFFGGRIPRGPQRQSGVGSGFVIDPNGTILTNYHVVGEAEKISVTLSDGKSFEAKVIGKDPKTDIAVIEMGTSEPGESWAG